MNPIACIVIRKDNEYLVLVACTPKQLKDQYKQAKDKVASFPASDWSLTVFKLGTPDFVPSQGAIVLTDDGWKYYTRHNIDKKGASLYDGAKMFRPCVDTIDLDVLD